MRLRSRCCGKGVRGTTLVHQIEVQEFQTFHPNFTGRSGSFQDFDNGLHTVDFLEDAEGRGRVNKNAKQAVQNGGGEVSDG